MPIRIAGHFSPPEGLACVSDDLVILVTSRDVRIGLVGGLAQARFASALIAGVASLWSQSNNTRCRTAVEGLFTYDFPTILTGSAHPYRSLAERRADFFIYWLLLAI